MTTETTGSVGQTEIPAASTGEGISIRGSTRVMGIIGDPISQARTPQAINPVFCALGADIVCVPFHIPASDLKTAWSGFKIMRNLIGFGVTLPHKNEVTSLCDRLDPVAERVGAVNVVRREVNNDFCGYQFDGQGFIGGLRSQHHDPKGRDCLIIGAGGAAAAIAFGLIDAEAASVTITNRTKEKASALADHVSHKTGSNNVSAGEPVSKDHQIIINATSLGMSEEDPYPFDASLVNSTNLVADVVAKPRITGFLAAARLHGATIHSGEHMIQGQIDLIAQHMMQASGGPLT